jgi:hypothetical protein
VSDADDPRAVTAAQRAVDDPAARVLENRYTDFDEPGGGGGGGPTIPSPYPTRVDPGLRTAPKDHRLSKALGMVTAQKAYTHLRLAVADLTDDRSRPVYVGYRDSEQTFIASTAKLAILLPAFALREAARDAAAAITAKNEADFFQQLARAWRTAFARHFRGGKATNTRPDLPRILSAKRAKQTDPFTIDFTMQEAVDWTQRGFHQRMLLALKYSENPAAASCIRDLAFPYIHGVHKSAGLFTRNGLWVSLDFGGRHWDPDFSGSGQAATARSLAELLTLIAQDRLAASGLAAEIRLVMGTYPGASAGSDLGRGILDRLPEAEKSTLSLQGKIGYDDGLFADAIILRRTSAKGKNLAYVAVALGGKSHEEIQQAGVALDDCMLLAHGEAVKLPANP